MRNGDIERRGAGWIERGTQPNMPLCVATIISGIKRWSLREDGNTMSGIEKWYWKKRKRATDHMIRQSVARRHCSDYMG
jgi:hypothetical protein